MKRIFWSLIAFLPATAMAQFTTVITPPKKEAPPAIAAATVSEADSSHRARITDMKVWVDSAASAMGIADTAAVISDTAMVEPVFAQQAPEERSERRVRREQAPGRLPDTASPIPFIMVTGIALLGVAIFLWLGAMPAESRVRGDRRQ